MDCPVLGNNIAFCLLDRCRYWKDSRAFCDYTAMHDREIEQRKTARIEENKEQHMAVDHG